MYDDSIPHAAEIDNLTWGN